MPDLTLLVLAAGIGRRFQGLKQVEAVGPSGEAMLDYAVHDALLSGFSRVVFVIRREIESAFRASIGDLWEPRVPVSYVYQELDDACRRDSAFRPIAVNPGAPARPSSSAGRLSDAVRGHQRR